MFENNKYRYIDDLTALDSQCPQDTLPHLESAYSPDLGTVEWRISDQMFSQFILGGILQQILLQLESSSLKPLLK